MAHKLFEYQITGADWLAQPDRNHRLLADEMGLGKSAQAITAAKLLGLSSIIVFCPAIARFTWLREFYKFGGESFPNVKVIQSGTDKPLMDGVTICSYDLAAKIERYGTDLIVLDESQYLKSLDADRTKAIFGKKGKDGCDGWVHYADRTWALSGTPAPNHVAELWPLLFTFGITSLSYKPFVERYCNYLEMPPYGLRIFGTKDQYVDEVKGMLAKCMLRRKKADVLKELPPRIYGEVVVTGGNIDIDAELQKKVQDEKVLIQMALDSGVDPATALAGVAKSVSTLRRINGLQKVEPAAHLVDCELALGLYDKIVLFGMHRDVLLGLAEKLSRHQPAIVMGGVSDTEKQAAVDRFQNDPNCKVFIGNVHAAGTNITLTASHNVLMVEPDWVPGVNQQCGDRCHRIGTTAECVNIRFLSLVDSLDFRVTETLARKTKELTDLLG